MKIESNDTRQHILDSGYNLMVSTGFSSVGLAEILKSAGVPKGSFYYYFNGYLNALETLFQSNQGTAYERLLEYWKRWISSQSDDCAGCKCLVVKLSAEVADLSGPMRLALLSGSSKVIERIANCIADGIKDGSIIDIDADDTAEQLYNMWLGASLLSKLHRSGEGLQRVMKKTQSILVNKSIG